MRESARETERGERDRQRERYRDSLACADLVKEAKRETEREERDRERGERDIQREREILRFSGVC